MYVHVYHIHKHTNGQNVHTHAHSLTHSHHTHTHTHTHTYPITQDTTNRALQNPALVLIKFLERIYKTLPQFATFARKAEFIEALAVTLFSPTQRGGGIDSESDTQEYEAEDGVWEVMWSSLPSDSVLHMHLRTQANAYPCICVTRTTCAYTQAHMHTNTHARKHTCTQAHMHTSTHAHKHTCTQTHMHIQNTHKHTHTHTHTHTNTHTHN